MAQELTDFMPLDRQLFDRSLGELMAAFVRRRWPRDTAKTVARTWDIDPATAANLIKGHVSAPTLHKALKAEGWPLFMALGEAITGEDYVTHLRGVANERERAAERAAARRDTVRSLEARASAVVSLHGGPVA